MIRTPRMLRRFARDTHGGITVESALWLPFWILFMFSIGEVAMVYHGQARALDVLQTANRHYSTGYFADADETTQFVQDTLATFSDNVQSMTVIEDGVITTVAAFPAGDFTGNIGIFTAVADLTITVRAQQVLEF